MSEITGPPADIPSVMRSKTMQVSPCGSDTYWVRAQLSDTSPNADNGCDTTDAASNRNSRVVIHDFGLEAVVQAPALTIAELKVWADTHPYRQCPAILPSCEALVGKSLAGGWRKAVLETLASTSGCTHVVTLLLGLAEVRTMVFFAQMNAAQAFNETTRADGRWMGAALDLNLPIVNACHVLTDSGPIIGTARARRHWGPRPRSAP